MAFTIDEWQPEDASASFTESLRSCRQEEHDTLDSLALVGIDRQLWFMGI